MSHSNATTFTSTFLVLLAGVALFQTQAQAQSRVQVLEEDLAQSCASAAGEGLGVGEATGSCLLQLSKTPVPKRAMEARLSPGMFWGYRFEVLEPSVSLLELGSEGAASDSEQRLSIQDLVQPSSEPYNLAKGTDRDCYAQWGQDRLLYPILRQIPKGFFVESGAFDGEEGSNTILYELKGWNGVLVEPGRLNFATLMQKHRRAYAFNGALSPTTQTETLKFSGTSTQNEHLSNEGSFPVTATPLTELLRPLNQSTVDFWSLDIEGSEGVVLEHTDFSKIEVGVLLIEMNKSGENNDRVKAVMKKEGFVDIGTSLYNEGRGWEDLDHIFVNPKYFKARGLKVPTGVERREGGC